MKALNIINSKTKSYFFNEHTKQCDRFDFHHTMSRHAKIRSQQRGIRSWVIDFILDNADLVKEVGCGSVSQFISEKKIAKLITNKILTPACGDALKGVVVIDRGATVTTVFHKKIRMRT